MPFASTADVARMRDQLFFEGDHQSAKLTRFWLLLVLAAIIAASGVLADSTATVIGAMIVAPLMVPILGIVLAVVLADRTNLLRCLGLVLTGSIAVVAVGWLVGLMVHSPVIATTNSQVAARVSPRLIDLIAALATGAVGSIALAREDISDTLPGVAIAISLVPPLAVAGLTLESGHRSETFGALLLFMTNVSAILTAGLIVMTVYRVRGEVFPDAATESGIHRRRAIAVIVAGMVVISIPLAFTSRRIATSRSTESKITVVADGWARASHWEIASVVTRPEGVLIRATGPSPEPDATALGAALAAVGLGNEHITIQLIPSRSVEVGAR